MPNQDGYPDVAVVGVTGDPPTQGHAWLIRTALKTGLFDQVWIMPCFGHRLGKEPTVPAHRYRMCEILASEIDDPPRVQASPWEMILQLDGTSLYTYNHLKWLHRGWSFTWVIGMDNALTIDNWAFSDRLKAGEVPFLVLNRGGIKVPEGDHWFQHEPHRFYESDEEPPIESASSAFRRLYKAGDPAYHNHITRGIFRYIEQQGLYR